jgi:hypothetical protein
MCLFFNSNNKNEKNEKCFKCGEYINENNPYLFKIIGLGKYDNKYICSDCLLDKLIK